MTPEVTSKFAHDLRASLRTIVTRIQLVQTSGDAVLAGEDRTLLQEAIAAARDMDGLLSAMVAYSQGHREEGSVNLGLLLRGLLIESKTALSDAGADLSLVNDLDLPVPAGLKGVLKELLANACRFRSTERPLRIVISTRTEPEAVEILVSDNGIGVGPEYLEKIFAPFFRLHSRDEFPGYGLGLATCRHIVAEFGGSIVAEQSDEPGLTMRLKIPLCDRP